MKQVYLLLGLIALCIIYFIFQGNNMLPKEKYGVYIGYPTGYVSEFNNAHSVLLNSKSEIITRFGGNNGTTGQLGHGVQNSSNELTEIPSKIEVMWISFTENQFWHGEFELPKDELNRLLNGQKMLDLFLNREGQHIDKYRQIIVNVAPKGKVYVYVGGAATQLIGTFQAKAIDYDWEQHAQDTWWLTENSVIESRDEYVKMMVDDDIKLVNNLNNIYKEDFFRPVSWTLAMKGKEELLAYVTDTLNGENINVLVEPTKEVMRSLPKEIAFDYVHDKKVKRLNIIFNKPYEFFKEHLDFRSKFKILVEIIDEDYTSVYFQQGEKIIEFEDIRVQEYER
ncbi:DUF2931 family protein [Acinetobacter faecalis]|uniref:DUF2931 family protein n=1 Tax=Acinetobacter faecalis TaxID=2665161 RepID=UPI002A9187F6|nr:DUF2931 family protein [Acinetobacter faecalis]MDY6451618.1 DUF2931 family protein [Acinetobacter faecalis]